MSQPLIRSASGFVGRVNEIEWLTRNLQHAVAGEPRVALLIGEAGTGKTRLLGELRRIATHAKVPVCSGHCSEDAPAPYFPFLQTLAAQIEHAGGNVEACAGPDAQAVKGILFGEGSITPGRPDATDDSEQKRLSLALVRAMVRMARRRATVIVLDDLHDADRASLDLFAHLVFAAADAANSAALPLLIVAALRPPESNGHLGRMVARLEREPICEKLVLEGLEVQHVAALIRELSQREPASGFLDAVLAVTGGNPLFVQEILREMDRRGALVARDGRLSATILPAELPFGGELASIYAARIAALEKNCRKVCTVGACLGGRFNLEMLRAVTGIEEDDLLDLLEEAQTQGLVASDGDAFRLAHPLVRYVLYNGASIPRRQRIHRQIAHCLELMLQRDPGNRGVLTVEIARHLMRCGPAADPAMLIHYARQAGDHAFSVGAWEEAAQCYEAVLSAVHVEQQISPRDRAKLHYKAALARDRNMDLALCLAHCDRAADAAREAEHISTRILALACKVRAQVLRSGVVYGVGPDLGPLEEELAKYPDAEPAVLCAAYVALCHAYFARRKPKPAVAFGERAREIALQTADDRLRSDAADALAFQYALMLRADEALRLWNEALLHARHAGDRWMEGWPLQRIPIVLIGAGRLDEAASVLNEAMSLTADTHDWRGRSIVCAALAVLAAARGELAACERHARDAFTMIRRSRYPWTVSLLPALACARAQRGLWPEAVDALEMLLEPGRIFDEPGPIVGLMVWIYRQLVRCLQDPPQEEMARIAAEVAPLVATPVSPDLSNLGPLCALAELSERVGAPKLAEYTRAHLTTAYQCGVLLSPGWVYVVPRSLGLACLAMGDHAAAEAHFEEAIQTAEQTGASVELGRACLDLARLVHQQGRSNLSVTLLRRAWRIFIDCRMEPFCRQALRLAEALDITLEAPPRVRYPDGLSEHQVLVLSHIARGQSVAQIAEHLLLSPATAALRCGEIFAQIGAAGAAEATAYALEHHLLTPDPDVYAEDSPKTHGLIAERQGANGPAAGRELTILFTDVVGFTALLQRLGMGEARRLLREHNRLIRGAIRKHGGREIQHTGDGFLASFSSALAAVECAVDIQRRMARHNDLRPDSQIHVRAGLNTGEILPEEERIFGLAVNLAARICARAGADQILASEAVRRLVPAQSAAFINRGRFVLKGFEQRFRLYEVQWRERSPAVGPGDVAAWDEAAPKP